MYGETGSPEVCSSNLTIQMCSYKIDLSARQGEQTSRFMQVSRAWAAMRAIQIRTLLVRPGRRGDQGNWGDDGQRK